MEHFPLSLCWPPLEIDGRTNVCLSSTRGEFGNSMFGPGASFLQLPNIVRTDSIAANCESKMLLGKYLSAADKKFIAWFSLSSAVTCGCVRYVCKYSSVSVTIKAFVLLSIAWMQR